MLLNFQVPLLVGSNRFYSIRSPYYFPDEGEPTITPDEDDDEESEDEESDDEEDEEDSEEEDKEDEQEGLEAKDKKEEGELVRVEYAKIKEKYPDFFKTFPDLKHAFFREQQFTEIFPTIEEARKAAEIQLAYEEITAAVIEGDVEKFITELKSESEDGVKAFANNFLPTLQKANRELYFEVIGPQVGGFIKNVYKHGIDQDNDNIKNAAKIVHKILFGGSYEDVEKEGGLLNQVGKKDDKVSKEKEEWAAQKYRTLYDDVTNVCYSQLDSEIIKGLEDIKKSRPGLVKLISKDIRDRILKDMDKDAAYMGRMSGLWKREQRSGFTGQLRNSLTTTFMAKAKTLIPKHRSEVRKETIGKEVNGSGGHDATRITGNKSSNTSAKGKMTPERQRSEKLNTRQVFEP